jgi:hypothetical protein
MKRLFFSAILFTATLTSCHYITGKRISGNGVIKTENRTAGSFNSVDISGNIDLYVKQDSVSNVRIEADENLMQYIKVEADGETLNIYPEDHYNLRPTHHIKVYVSGPSFKHFEASGACDIYSENKISSSNAISINASGASTIKMELKAPAVNTDLSGASNISLSGETKNFRVDGSGASHIKCFDLMTEETYVEISGAGDAEVFASVKLDVHVSGAGDVKYKGNAAVTQEVSGAGSVKKVD